MPATSAATFLVISTVADASGARAEMADEARECLAGLTRKRII
jgi:hypothetical protein